MALDPRTKLEAIVKGARAILRHQQFEDSARAIFDLCCEMTGASAGYVALLSEDGNENEVVFLEAGGRSCTVDPELPMPIRGLRADSYRTHRPVYENHFPESQWVKFMPAGHVPMANVMFAPLNVDGKTVGIIGLANKPSDFTDEDAATAADFGDLAAIALVHSRYLDLLKEKNESLERAMSEIHTLQSLLPICSRCRQVRDDEGVWSRMEEYFSTHAGMQFSHGLCPDCIRELYPEDADKILSQIKPRRTNKHE